MRWSQVASLALVCVSERRVQGLAVAAVTVEEDKTTTEKHPCDCSERSSAAERLLSSNEEVDDFRAALLITLTVALFLFLAIGVAYVFLRNRRAQLLAVVPVFSALQSRKLSPEVDVRWRDAAVQTVPQITVELRPGAQKPMHLVFCVDSSASVGAKEFEKATEFVKHVVDSAEMPTVMLGLIRFHHLYSTVSELVGDFAAFSRSIAGLQFEPGETRMAPPLWQARAMLQRGAHTEINCTRAVVVLSDGDPNDFEETEKAAAAIREDGIQLLFVQLGSNKEKLPVYEQLSSQPAERHVCVLSRFSDASEAAAEVLSNVLQVSMWIKRAKCMLNWTVCQEATLLDAEAGDELLVPGWERDDEFRISWQPHRKNHVKEFRTISWDPKFRQPPVSDAIICGKAETVVRSPRDVGLQTETVDRNSRACQTNPAVQSVRGIQTDPLPPACPPQKLVGVSKECQTFSSMKVESSSRACQTGQHVHSSNKSCQTSLAIQTPRGIQTDPSPPSKPLQQQVHTVGVECQTVPSVKVCLAPWRQAPLDLVVVVASAVHCSLCGAAQNSKNPGMPCSAWSADFAAIFAERIAALTHTPEVNLALIRSGSDAQVLCPLTANRSAFSAHAKSLSLASVGPDAGRLAPSLRSALNLLVARNGVRRNGWASELAVSRSVVVVATGMPTDPDEAALVAQELRAAESQLLIVSIGLNKQRDAATADFLEALAVTKPLPPTGLFEAGSSNLPRGVFEVSSQQSATVFSSVVPDVLRQVLSVSRYVKKAFCTTHIFPFEEVEDNQANDENIQVVLGDGRVPLIDPKFVRWQSV